MTALSQGEMVTAVRIPVPAAGHGYAYEKLKRKVGDYATAAAAVILTMAQGKVATCSIGLTNLSETPLWAEEAAKASAPAVEEKPKKRTATRKKEADPEAEAEVVPAAEAAPAVPKRRTKKAEAEAPAES